MEEVCGPVRWCPYFTLGPLPRFEAEQVFQNRMHERHLFSHTLNAEVIILHIHCIRRQADL